MDQVNLYARGPIEMISPAPMLGSAVAAGTYELDPPHTFILFSAKHLVVGRVDGRFDRAKGTVTIAPDLAESGVDVSIDSQSLSTQNGIRDEDLRGPDFFAAVKYPEVTYQGRGVRKSGDGWIMDGGALTIRGVTRTVPLWFAFKGAAPVIPDKPNRIAFHATTAVKRAEITHRRTYARSSLPKKAISTVHKAKGLECSSVLNMPCDGRHFSNSIGARRRLYVAMSRATRSLTFVVSRDVPSPLFRL